MKHFVTSFFFIIIFAFFFSSRGTVAVRGFVVAWNKVGHPLKAAKKCYPSNEGEKKNTKKCCVYIQNRNYFVLITCSFVMQIVKLMSNNS